MASNRSYRFLLLTVTAVGFLFVVFIFSATLFAATPGLVIPAATNFANTTPFTDTPSVQVYLPWVAGPPPSQLLIAAAHIDSAISGEPDEAILLWNIGEGVQALAGWQLRTASRTTTFPITSTLQVQPGQRLWCAAQATAFRSSFGENPACEWDGDTDPTVLNLDVKLTLANGGGHIQLLNSDGQLVDTLLYGDEQQPVLGWTGAAAQLYTRGVLAASGQIWQRKLNANTGQPGDTDHASDWNGDLSDLDWGRRVRMPGWQGWGSNDLAWPATGTADSAVTVAVGPEGLYQPLAAVLTAATHSIDLSIYTLEHREMAQILAATAQRGVQVRILLEGSPPGGISDLQKWCVAEIAAAGGQIRYLAPLDDAPTGYRTRYRFSHAKYGVIDGGLAINGTENFNYDAMPTAVQGRVGGRRGFYLITTAPPVVATLRQLFAIDWAPDRFLDLHPFELAHAKYGGPPVDFVFPELNEYDVRESPFRAPATFSGLAQFVVISAPENAIRPDAGLNALIRRAGAGDEIILEQLYENKNWGKTTSNPIADPNPRLLALIEAARRGVRVRLLLDSFFDEPDALRSNRATVDYVQNLATTEGLDLEARLGNPTLGGIHAKLALVRLGAERWSAVGSLNGGETSHKLNREVMVMTDLAGVYERLKEVFTWDWAQTQ